MVLSVVSVHLEAVGALGISRFHFKKAFFT